MLSNHLRDRSEWGRGGVMTYARAVDVLFFFFQAEDGIRDLTVTGVQTCALPIFARRVLERFVAEYPNDPHAGSALFLLGRARFALGDTESALEAFRRAQAAIAPPEALEAKFWEPEPLIRLRRYPHAGARDDQVVKTA